VSLTAPSLDFDPPTSRDPHSSPSHTYAHTQCHGHMAATCCKNGKRRRFHACFPKKRPIDSLLGQYLSGPQTRKKDQILTKAPAPTPPSAPPEPIPARRPSARPSASSLSRLFSPKRPVDSLLAHHLSGPKPEKKTKSSQNHHHHHHLPPRRSPPPLAGHRPDARPRRFHAYILYYPPTTAG